MRALVYSALRTLEIQEVPEPVVEPGLRQGSRVCDRDLRFRLAWFSWA